MTVLSEVPSAAKPPLLSGTDIRNFVLFTLAFGVLYALLIGVFMGASVALLPQLVP